MRGNSVSVAGNITRDAETRVTQNGRVVVLWGLAWNDRRKNQQTQEWEDHPHYFDVKCWCSQPQADKLLPKLTKGAKCAVVDGHLVYEQWEKDGQKRSKVVIQADDPIGGVVVNNAYRSAEAADAYQGGSRYLHNGQEVPQPVQQDMYSDTPIPF